MTAIEYARLRELAEKATPGPWRIDHEEGSSEFGDYIVYGIEGVCDADWVGDGAPSFAYTEGMSYADAEYIAATDPQTVLALLDEIERLRGTLARILGYTRGAVRRLMPEELAELERERRSDD